MADLVPTSPPALADPPSPLVEAVLRQYLTAEEEAQIRRQFQQACLRDKQVLWTGMKISQAQKWADDHQRQTLTTAMGPLMNPKHPQCLQHQKSKKAWSKYVHGASAVFAWYISGGELVTLLTQPPPDRFNPQGPTYYQIIEEPIVTGKIGGRAVKQIQVVHPAVTQAVDFTYQVWPVDEVLEWKKRYGMLRVVNPRWRLIGAKQLVTCRNIVARSKDKALDKVSESNKTPSKETQGSACKPGHKTKAKGTNACAAKLAKGESSKAVEARGMTKSPNKTKAPTKAKKQQNGSPGAHTKHNEVRIGIQLQTGQLLLNEGTGKKKEKKCKRRKKRQRNKSRDIETSGG
ncbi:hypothetical protein ACJZ2D_014098 [Fusarium nematophilum]